MNLVTHLGRVAAAAALVLTVTPVAPAQELDPLTQQISATSAALIPLLERLSSPDVSRRLIDTAIRGDVRGYNQILDGIELPVVDKCFWVTEVLQKFTTVGGFVEQCSVRTDLSDEEWFQYTVIALQHGQGKGGTFDEFVTDSAGHTYVNRGAFLDALKANGLVSCALIWKTTGRTTAVLQAPERLCVKTPY